MIVSGDPRSSGDGPVAWGVWLVLGLWALMMVWLTLLGEVQHDYRLYVRQWELVLAGANPWATDNAYGPLHNLLASLLPAGPFAPKLFMTASFVGAVLLLAKARLRATVGAGSKAARMGQFFLLVPGNFLTLASVCVFGLNDSLVASLVLGAVLARHHGRAGLAGFLLGLAVLLKYYPIFLVALLAVEQGRLRARLLLVALATIGVGLALAILAWGDAFLAALMFGHARPARILSILAALGQVGPALGLADGLVWLERINTPCVLLAGAGGLLAALHWRLHWLEAGVIGLLSVLLTYKVGHQQFYLTWLCLVAALPIAGTPSAARLARLCLPLAVFLSLFQLSYFIPAYDFEAAERVRAYAGFPAFGLGVFILVGYFRHWPGRGTRLHA